jgi:UDP-N-acetylglucosamine 2-epimerase (non-hydrolysing)
VPNVKILIVVGARPNFMKVAPIIAAIDEHNTRTAANSAKCHELAAETIQHILVHTGQHYDDLMSGSFFSDLNLPKPDVHLGVGSGSHAVQTAEIMKEFEGVLMIEKPEVVVVVGDVNSTVACALVASKISFDSAGSRPLIAHVEAGLRSFDRSMPEEINRIVTDHLSDLVFVTEESGLQNLRNEGVSPNSIHFVGNTMIDSLLTFNEKAESSTILEELGLRVQAGKNGASNSITRYALLTLHRPSNVDNRDTLVNIMAGLEELATDCPIIFPAHPRTRRRIEEFGLEPHLGMNGMQIKGATRDSGNSHNGIILTVPMGYLDFLCLMKHASIVVTDSGGIQEETTCLGIPCVTVRENTERPVTVESGTNIIAGTGKEGIKNAIQRQMKRKGGNGVPRNWDGQAAARILDVLIRTCSIRTSSRQPSIPQPCA